MAHLDGAVLHGIEHLQAGDDFAGGEGLDLEFVVGGFRDELGDHLGAAVDACRAISASSPSSRHLISGIDCAMAGARRA